MLDSCFICLPCTTRDIVMASLSEIVDQKLGASSRSKPSITSGSYFRISIHAPCSYCFFFFSVFCFASSIVTLRTLLF